MPEFSHKQCRGKSLVANMAIKITPIPKKNVIQTVILLLSRLCHECTLLHHADKEYIMHYLLNIPKAWCDWHEVFVIMQEVWDSCVQYVKHFELLV